MGIHHTTLGTTAFLLGALFSPLHAAQTVTEKVNLLDVIRAGEVDYHINPDADVHDDPSKVFTFADDGTFHISGCGYGYAATKQDFRDYHLVLEFKWGSKTWGKREKAAKDNGILLHAYGPHGIYGGNWMASIEAQIIEGGVGDILVLSPKLKDGTELTTSVTAEISLDRDKEKVWTPGAPSQVVTKGRINWRGRDVDWADRVGFRGKDDVESPPGDWNRMEVIARGDTLEYFVNGTKVNAAFDCKPSEGKVLIQTEAAEMIVRRYELWPLDTFKEKWNPIQASGGTNVSVRDGQDHPLPPEESLQRIQLDGPYEAQLVASEPLVFDPAEVTWDEKGRLFVADMMDYPLGPPNAGDPPLSRIVELIDDNGDGRMDRSVIFADHVDHVQGLLAYDGGLIATTRTQILYLKDHDGDGKADENRPLIQGFNPKHSQLQVSAPRWGPDGCVYFNNGLSAAEIYPVEEGKTSKEAINIGRTNFKWDPKTGQITPVTGYGQYGAAFDDWGHYFFCSNRNPLMFAVMPYQDVHRNPRAGIATGLQDIAPFGADTRVFPLQITHTTADAHAGTNTACSGIGVYRGSLMPELKNNVFVPDPSGQLITRYQIEPDGASLKATRVGKHTEFFRSSDEWCRPVNFTTGPDGAIYVCDFYRRWLDHARFFPEEFVKTHDMRQGEHHGRIYRIVPKGTAATAAANGFAPSATQPFALPLPAESPARATFLRVPQISDPAELAAILTQHADDPWMSKMVASAASGKMGRILSLLGDAFFTKYSETRTQTLRTFASGALADADAQDTASLLSLLQKQPGKLLWWKPALLQGLAKLPKGHPEAALEIAKLMRRVEAVMTDAKAPLDQRLAVLPLLSQRPWKTAEPILRKLFTETEISGGPLRDAALTALKKYPATTSAPLLYDLLKGTQPELRREAVSLLAANAGTVLDLFKRMVAGEVSPAMIDSETRWRYLRNTGEIGELAKQLFDQPSEDRATVIATYMGCASQKGDAEQGKQVFLLNCSACHRVGDQGADVGPSLSDVKVKPPEALLSDILDPNRMFEARWSAYQIDTQDGRTLSGLLDSETADTVTLKLMGGATQTVSRSEIKTFQPLDRTLMPVGLEAAITPEQMTHLLAFLMGK
ncbi:MAG: DUF1080 domain-containing protein [Verrucomicrobiales bacterium]|nr:DUF1080 domain-containing protein [Verrucomicrobiales bacterium]